MEKAICESIQNVVTYNEKEDNVENILKVLSDKYCRDILIHTRDNAQPAHIIARNADIPLSTVYRRIQDMVDSKLLIVSGEITEDGKKVFLYHNTVHEINAFFDGGITTIKVTHPK